LLGQYNRDQIALIFNKSCSKKLHLCASVFKRHWFTQAISFE